MERRHQTLVLGYHTDDPIAKDGNPYYDVPKVDKPVNPALDPEIAKAIAAMPKWTPGMHEGQAVRVKCNLYVEINLNNKKVNVSLTQPAPRWGFGFGPF